ncbi:MAG: thioredoxin family protein [Ilumatobacteraceae bacterium]
MNVTLLYFDDCPNWKVADGHLRTLAAEHPGMEVQRRIVDTAEDAESTNFRGSPSIIVDGVDLFAKPDDPVGLSCRMYQTPHGPAGAPTLDQLRLAIASNDCSGPNVETTPDTRSTHAD